MRVNKYQPMQFSEDSEPCKCDTKGSLLAQSGDTTSFQVQMQVCDNSPNLIHNGDFGLDNGSGWDTNFTISELAATSDSEVENFLNTVSRYLEIDSFYQIELDVTSNDGLPFVVYFGTKKIAEISTSGNKTISGVCEGDVANNQLRIESPVGNRVIFSQIAMYPLEKDFTLKVLNGEGTVVGTRTYAQDVSDGFFTMFRKDRDVLTVNFPWDYITDDVPSGGLGLSYGCYSFQVIGTCSDYSSEMLADPEMVTTNESDKFGSLSLGDYPYSAEVSSSVYMKRGTGYMLQNGVPSGVATPFHTLVTGASIQPIIGRTYLISLEIIDPLFVTKELTVTFGGATAAAITAQGVHNFGIVATDTSGLVLDFRNDTGSDGVKLGYVRIAINPPSVISEETTFSSNSFDFKEVQLCSKFIYALNNQDAYGLKFQSSFYLPKVRLKGNVRADSFNTDVEDRVDTNGTKHIDFFEQRKSENLQLQNIPEYLIDWLSLFRGFSSVFIDGVEYVINSDLDIEWNRFCDLGKVQIEIGEKTQEVISTKSK